MGVTDGVSGKDGYWANERGETNKENSWEGTGGMCAKRGISVAFGWSFYVNVGVCICARFV